MAAFRPAGGSALIKLRAAGVAFLVVIVALVGLTVLLYDKAFTPVVRVTLSADRVGNQLTPPADVKIRGLLVGEVRGVSSTGGGANVDLALQPDKMNLIPKNVQARLVPKTLFGEKYVQLVIPAQASPQELAAGDTIPQDRSQTALETERVIDDLLPLLKTLNPQDLSTALGALSGALRDRGAKLGDNLVRVDDYLRQLNPTLPTIQADMRGIADLANTFDQAAPDFLAVLDNLSFTSRSLVDQRQELATFLKSTTGFSGSADSFLRDNRSRLIGLAADSRPDLGLLAQYSPEYPCLLKGLDNYQGVLSNSFGGLQPGLHITLETTKDNGGYAAKRDEPQFLDQRGPNCMGLPSPTGQAPDVKYKDGYMEAQKSGTASQTSGSSANAQPSAYLGDAQLGALVAPLVGQPAAQVTSLASLLVAPIARGMSVGVS